MKKLLTTFIILGAGLVHANEGLNGSLATQAKVNLLNPLSACWVLHPELGSMVLNPVCFQKIHHQMMNANGFYQGSGHQGEDPQALPNCTQRGLPKGTIIGTNPECMDEISMH